LSSLINRLAEFEEHIAAVMDARGEPQLADKARENARELMDIKDFIIIEMTLEPINTIDPLEELDKDVDPEAVRRRVYRVIARDVEHVSGELADLLRRLSS